MAVAVATEEMPGWVAVHLNCCSHCRRGLAYVVGRSSRLTERERGLASQVAFVAKVRGLSREVSRLHQSTPPDRRRWYPVSRLDRIRGFFTDDWRLPSAVAMALALLSAGLAFYLIAVGPSQPVSAEVARQAPAVTQPARLTAPADR